MIKSWNTSAKKTHGKRCHVTRPKHIITKENKFEKRKEGVLYFGDDINFKPIIYFTQKEEELDVFKQKS